jgi:putative addiction module component (TIGR02574 family)
MNFEMIRAEALKLPLKSRGHLASDLLHSLDAFNEAENEQLWLEEAQRRAKEIDDGTVELVSWEEVNRRAEAVLNA